jgi:hypothetical protein
MSEENARNTIRAINESDVDLALKVYNQYA